MSLGIWGRLWRKIDLSLRGPSNQRQRHQQRQIGIACVGPDAPVQTSIAGAAVRFFLGNPGLSDSRFQRASSAWMGPVRPRLVPVSTSCSPFQDSRPVSTTRPLFVDPGDIDSHSRLLDSSSRLLCLTTPNNPNLRFPSPPPTPYSLSPTPRLVSPPPRPPRLLSRVATGLGTSSYVTRSAIEVLSCFPGTQDSTLPRGLRVVPSLSRGVLQRWSPPPPTTASSRRHLPSVPLRLSDTSNDAPHTLSDAILTLLTTALISSPPWACRPTLALMLVGDPFAVSMGQICPEEACLVQIDVSFSENGASMDGQVVSSPMFRWRPPFAAMSLANKHASIGL